MIHTVLDRRESPHKLSFWRQGAWTEFLHLLDGYMDCARTGYIICGARGYEFVRIYAVN